MKTLIYCRVSSKKQEREGSGLSSQEKRCREFAVIQGYEVEKVFHDAFSGGGDFMNRPAMRELLDYVDAHQKTGYAVIFDDLKRFARDLKFHWELREAFRIRNLIPLCLNFTFEETPEGSFIETIIAAQGELERQQNKRQVIQKMKARMERGIYCMGGDAPYGFIFAKNNVYGGKVIELVPDQARIVKDAFEGFATTKLFHIKDVAYYINTHPQFSNASPLRVETVRKMLTNILYAGYVEYSPWNIMRKKGVHEAIISLNTFDTVQERILGKIPQRKRVDICIDFPLRGYVNCMHCKRSLTGSWSRSMTGKLHGYYRCGTDGCIFSGKSIPMDELHEQFKELLQSLIPNEHVLEAVKLAITKEFLYQQDNSSNYVSGKQSEINKLEQQMSALVNRIIQNPTSDLNDIYEAEIGKIKAKIKTLSATIDEAKEAEIHSEEDFELLLGEGMKKIVYSYESWVNGDYEVKKSVQEMLLNSNIEYGRIEGFGTPEKCYVLRLFEQIQPQNGQNFGDVDNEKKSSNLMQNSQFSTPMHSTYFRDNFIKIIQAFKNLSEFSTNHPSLKEVSKKVA